MVKDYNYGALSPLDTFANGDSTKAALIGATNTSVSNGSMFISADGKSISGTTQGSTGTSYVYEDITAAPIISFSVFWEITALGTIGAGLFFGGSGAGATRVCAMSLLSTEQIRFFSASGGTLFTSTVSGGFAVGKYRTDFVVYVGTTTSNGRIVSDTYTEFGTTPITGAGYDSGTTINTGTANFTSLRHGPRTGTGTADDNVRVAMRYEVGTTTYLGPPNTGYLSSPADAVGITDSAVVSRAFAVGLSDTVGIADTDQNQQIGYGVTQGDALGITDVATVTRTLASINPADPVGITDAVSPSLGRNVDLADGVGISDSATSQFGRGISLSDALGITDAVTQALARAAFADDILGITDSVTVDQARLTSATPADAVAITDSIETNFSTSGAANLGDGITITDVVGITRSVTTTYPEAVGISDTMTATLDREFNPGELVNITDSVTVQRTGGVNPGDPVAINDATLITQGRSEAPADLVIISDIIAVQIIGQDLDVDLADGIGITDVATPTGLAPQDYQFNPVDFVGIGDAMVARLTVPSTPSSSGDVYPHMPYPDLVIDSGAPRLRYSSRTRR